MVDGCHIKTLWITYIYRYMKPIIENGYLYLAKPPLYKVYKNGKSKNEQYYVYNDEELGVAKEKIGQGALVQRYKGLGEMNSDQLWETTMNPENRILEQVTIEDIEKDEYMLSLCMGEEVIPRKEFIMKYALNAKIDC